MDEGEADVFKSELIGSRWLFKLSQTQAKSGINITFSSTASLYQPPKDSRTIKERGLRLDTDRKVVKATIKASGDFPRHPIIGLLKCRGWGAEREQCQSAVCAKHETWDFLKLWQQENAESGDAVYIVSGNYSASIPKIPVLLSLGQWTQLKINLSTPRGFFSGCNPRIRTKQLEIGNSFFHHAASHSQRT